MKPACGRFGYAALASGLVLHGAASPDPDTGAKPDKAPQAGIRTVCEFSGHARFWLGRTTGDAPCGRQSL